MSERKISIPPPNSTIAIGGGVSFAGVTTWLIYMLLELQAGQIRMDERLKVIEARLPPQPIIGAFRAAPERDSP